MVEIPKNILVVDDDEQFLASIRRMIQVEGFPWRVFTRSSAMEALSMVELSTMDLILTDLLMPGRDGFWLIEQLRASPLYSNIPIIVLSGDGEEKVKRKALQMGVTDLLNKPFDPEDLFLRINNNLLIKEYQDELLRKNKVLEKEVFRRTTQLEVSRIDILWKLARAGEFRDEMTGNHVIRVGYLSEYLAREAGLPETEINLIFMTSPLHDIGKIGIPDSILRKPDKLTEAEMKVMRKHCEYGRAILLDRSNNETYLLQQLFNQKGVIHQTDFLTNPLLDKAAEIAYTHHENWDGSGYPTGLKGDNIPISGRIVAIADTYDSLRSLRPYKWAISGEQTIQMIQQQSGKRFDPSLVDLAVYRTDGLDEIWTRFVKQPQVA